MMYARCGPRAAFGAAEVGASKRAGCQLRSLHRCRRPHLCTGSEWIASIDWPPATGA